MADFEWDTVKELLKLLKHGFDFPTAQLIWDGDIVERTDNRRDYGETRIIAIGELEDTAVVVVYTWRGENRRIISARQANSHEKAVYEAEIASRGRAPRD